MKIDDFICIFPSAYFSLIRSLLFLAQAEAGELAMKVQTLTNENFMLKSEITKLMENSDKLKIENTTLMVLIFHLFISSFFCLMFNSFRIIKRLKIPRRNLKMDN